MSARLSESAMHDQVKMAYTLHSQTVLQAPSIGTQRNPLEFFFFGNETG